MQIQEDGDLLPPESGTQVDALSKLTRDLKEASKLLTPAEARYLVDSYYVSQDSRIRTGNQMFQLEKQGKPMATIGWYNASTYFVEHQVELALGFYARGQKISRWAMSITGIGPILSAGLLAYIDITKAPSVGHIYRFGGIAPNMKWYSRDDANELVDDVLEKAKGHPDEKNITYISAIVANRVGRKPENFLRDVNRLGKNEPTMADVRSAASLPPWNAGLKTLCWKIGESFMMQSTKKDAFYGPYYISQKAKEEERNDRGEFAKQAAEILASKKKPGKSTEAYKAYIVGRLPKAHILARAKRWVTKLFLSHYHYKARTYAGLPAPRPYALDHLGHTDYIEPPQDIE